MKTASATALTTVVLLMLAGASGCADTSPEGGALAIGNADQLVAQAQAGGRTWRVYNNCAMARNTTWVSDDGGKHWLHHDGPGWINCTSASTVRLRPHNRDVVTADVNQGPRPVHEVWRTTNGGSNWTMRSTDLGG